MFDISFGELAVVAGAAVLFLKPADVPVVIRSIAKAVRWVKRMSRELMGMVEEVIEEPRTTMIKGDDGQYYQAYDLQDVEQKK